MSGTEGPRRPCARSAGRRACGELIKGWPVNPEGLTDVEKGLFRGAWRRCTGVLGEVDLPEG